MSSRCLSNAYGIVLFGVVVVLDFGGERLLLCRNVSTWGGGYVGFGLVMVCSDGFAVDVKVFKLES